MQINWKKFFFIATVMKGICFLLVFCGLVSLETVFGLHFAAEPETETNFKKWMIEHNKMYLSQKLYSEKLNIFLKNEETIKRLNGEREKYGHDVYFGLNKFADLTQKEFQEKILMRKKKPVEVYEFQTRKYNVEVPLPDHFNWKDIVGKVRDQGDAGTCWAFSAVQTIESQWAMKMGKHTELSVEQVVDCDGMHDSKHADCGVFGGWPYLAYNYIKKAGGIETEESYSYCCGLGGDKGTCYVCPAKGYNKTLCGPPVEYCKAEDSCEAKLDSSLFVPGLQVKSWFYISKNETEIAEALVSKGPLSVLLNADTLQFYKRGIWDPIICDPTSLDHGVLLTGFGHSKGLLGNKDYWIIKNSWGEKWGEDGYFRIARNKQKCGLNTQVTTVELEDK